MIKVIVLSIALWIPMDMIAQRSISTIVRVEFGASNIHDQTIKDQFEFLPSYMVAIGFEGERRVVDVFTNIRFSKKGAFNKVTSRNLSLFYAGIEGGVTVNHHLSKLGLGVYVDCLLNSDHESNRMNYDYVFNPIDLGGLATIDLYTKSFDRFEFNIGLSGGI